MLIRNLIIIIFIIFYVNVTLQFSANFGTKTTIKYSMCVCVVVVVVVSNSKYKRYEF